MALEHFRREEFAGALEYKIYAEVTPRNVRGHGMFCKTDGAIPHTNAISIDSKGLVPPSLNRVKLQQMCGSSDPTLDLVDMRHFAAVLALWVVFPAMGCAKRSTKRKAADTAHSIDSYSHVLSP
jgi:hypothetical protein